MGLGNLGSCNCGGSCGNLVGVFVLCVVLMVGVCVCVYVWFGE